MVCIDSTNFNLTGDYWLYHKLLIEDDEEEKIQPADKAWQIVKFTEQHGPDVPPLDRGFHLRIGDTVKFGRVRFKVIMIQNKPEGEQIYKESRFNQKTERKDHGHHQASSYRNTLSGEEDDEEDERDDEFEEHIVPEEEMALQSHTRNELASSLPPLRIRPPLLNQNQNHINRSINEHNDESFLRDHGFEVP